MCEKCRWKENIEYFLQTGSFYIWTDSGPSRSYDGVEYPKYNLGISEYNEIEKRAVTFFLHNLEKVPIAEHTRNLIRIPYERLRAPYDEFGIKYNGKIYTGTYIMKNVRICNKCGKLEFYDEETPENWHTLSGGQYVKRFVCKTCAEEMEHCTRCGE